MKDTIILPSVVYSYGTYSIMYFILLLIIVYISYRLITNKTYNDFYDLLGCLGFIISFFVLVCFVVSIASWLKFS